MGCFPWRWFGRLLRWRWLGRLLLLRWLRGLLLLGWRGGAFAAPARQALIDEVVKNLVALAWIAEGAQASRENAFRDVQPGLCSRGDLVLPDVLQLAMPVLDGIANHRRLAHFALEGNFGHADPDTWLLSRR